jgi:ABC-2 type transport system ATP-binding protein
MYIANGQILTRGTQADIIEQAGLAVWAIAGSHLESLVAPIKALPGVLSVSAFGNTLHVAGLDQAMLQASLAPYRSRADLQLSPSQVDLEDVFISLMDNANMRAAQVSA